MLYRQNVNSVRVNNEKSWKFKWKQGLNKVYNSNISRCWEWQEGNEGGSNKILEDEGNSYNGVVCWWHWLIQKKTKLEYLERGFKKYDNKHKEIKHNDNSRFIGRILLNKMANNWTREASVVGRIIGENGGLDREID